MLSANRNILQKLLIRKKSPPESEILAVTKYESNCVCGIPQHLGLLEEKTVFH